ncbi:sirohydrochlorin cobaltochelatase [Rubidibacter lacunae KORDI 51-2]|uniref:Sirohydrochlorin cobaltochelatase n=1 Tax=Rubidibacter lacunae KORDI 51-2 TaxID=582515 RepID=U5DN07_9CHRO|nr:sirohydrochlorin chelatase [Rubidibacter lacunae]ERN41999.1 sirohydrochlorin cobaltochelatase [Rubidibacter lacunae KORDI 51-2]
MVEVLGVSPPSFCWIAPEPKSRITVEWTADLLGVVRQARSPAPDRNQTCKEETLLTVATSPIDRSHFEQPALPQLPHPHPLLLVGHGTRDAQGRQALLDFARIYADLDSSRPVVPCFLELTTPSIQDGVDRCVAEGYTELTVLPVLLFAARHNKFDVTGELDRARLRHPQIQIHYGRHFGIAAGILDLWTARLAELDRPECNPLQIARSDTVLLFVGRGSSDPDANGDACKLARLLWEGSGYRAVETCFVGITHPRLEEGFAHARLYEPRRLVVLPHFLFTGVLVNKIAAFAAAQQAQFPETKIACLPELGVQPELLQVLRDREIEAQLGQVHMNCEACKFRRAAENGLESHGHHHHDRGHSHHHGDDPCATREGYHERAWQTP